MGTTTYIFIGILVLIALYLFSNYHRQHYLIRGSLFTCVSGVGALALANLFGGYVGLVIPFSVFTVGFCGVLGLPGFITLILFKSLWGL